LIIDEELEKIFCDREVVFEKLLSLVEKRKENWDGKEPLKFKKKIYEQLVRLGYDSEMIIAAINEKVEW
jgi:SOS response regulatory protein OraA/RecX